MPKPDTQQAFHDYIAGSAPELGSMFGIFCSVMLDAVERWCYETRAGNDWLDAMHKRTQEGPQQQELPFDKETGQ